MKKIPYIFATLLVSTSVFGDYKVFTNQKINIPEPIVDNSCPSEASSEIANMGPVLWYSSTNVTENNGVISHLNPLGPTTIVANSTIGRETLIEENAYNNCPAIVTDGDNMTANYNLGNELTYIFVGRATNGTNNFAPFSTYRNDNNGGLFIRSNNSYVGAHGRPTGSDYLYVDRAGSDNGNPVIGVAIANDNYIQAFMNGAWSTKLNTGSFYRDTTSTVNVMGDLIQGRSIVSYGKAYELIMFNRALTVSEVDIVYQSLKEKYNL